MIVHYRLIQFREDPLRAEGRNVAVFTWNEEHVYLRALSATSAGEVDSTIFERLLSPALRSNAWVYAEWVERWTDISRSCKGDPQRLQKELERLEETSGAHWVASEKGEIDIPSPPAPQNIWQNAVNPNLLAVHNAADILYNRLISSGMAGDLPISFLEAVDYTIMISEIVHHDGFSRSETIAVGKDAETETLLFFPYFVDGPMRTAIKLACFNGPSWEAAVSMVNDTILTFDLAVTAGFIQRDHCVVLTDSPMGEYSKLALRLERSATLIDVTATDPASQLHRLVWDER